MFTADEAAAKHADNVALQLCMKKNVLPHLNFPLSEYAASKDKYTTLLVKTILGHFQPMLKALPQTVQKQLADAEAALAAKAGRKKLAKRRRKSASQEGDELPAQAQQNGKAAKGLSAVLHRAGPETAAEADADFSSDASDLPDGIVGGTVPQPALKRLKRKAELDRPGSRPGHGRKQAAAPCTPQKPQRCEQTRASAEVLLGSEKVGAIGRYHASWDRASEHGNVHDSRALRALRVL